jgi:hypothetical protein
MITKAENPPSLSGTVDKITLMTEAVVVFFSISVYGPVMSKHILLAGKTMSSR